MKIQKPTIDKLDELIKLWEAQYTYHHNLDSDYYVENSKDLSDKFRDYLEKATEKDEPRILVAIVNDDIAGFITYEIDTEDYFDTKIKRFGSVIELYVLEEYRKQGIGKRLMQEVEGFFKKKDISWIELQASAKNALAEDFYENQGYKVRQKLFFKKIAN